MQPVEALVDWAIGCHAGHFSLVLGDLLASEIDAPFAANRIPRDIPSPHPAPNPPLCEELLP